MRAAIARDPDAAVIGSGPKCARIERRRRKRVDHAATRQAAIVGQRHRIEIGRVVFACGSGEIGTDDRPGLAGIARAEYLLARCVEGAIDR